MGIITSTKVLVALPTLTTLLVLSSIQTVSGSIPCERGKQFLHFELQICMNCTQCDASKDQLVFRPCNVHEDTLCAPFRKLWKSLRPENKHRHQKHHQGHRERHHSVTAVPVRSAEDELSDIVAVTSTEVPFSSVEALVWDWQAIALTFAVFSCILFFIVITLYSLHQARQWRRLKENFEADVEELSARLSLMAASSSEKGETLEPNFGPIHDTNYLNNKCMYLEQLLHVRKEKPSGPETGNVYIQESNGKT